MTNNVGEVSSEATHMEWQDLILVYSTDAIGKITAERALTFGAKWRLLLHVSLI